MPRRKPPIDPWYVTGFCEGEYALTYSRQSSGASVSPYFHLKLHEKDRPLLEAIQAYFGGVGTIYAVKDPRPTVGPKAYYRVASIRELQVIVRHFDRFPFKGRRAKGYAIWRAMVRLKDEHYGYPPNDALIEMARRLSLLNRRHAAAGLQKAEDRRLVAEGLHGEPVPRGTESRG